jgi:V-type H+-transporting ATPase subunit a
LNQSEKAGLRPLSADSLQQYANSRSQAKIDQLSSTLANLESRLLQMNSSQEGLSKRYFELTELRHVLRETDSFFRVVSMLH